MEGLCPSKPPEEMPSKSWTLTGILAAFGGGIFGAAIGALPAFEFVGFLVIVGVGIQMATGHSTFFGIPFGRECFGGAGTLLGCPAPLIGAESCAESRGACELRWYTRLRTRQLALPRRSAIERVGQWYNLTLPTRLTRGAPVQTHTVEATRQPGC